MAGTSVWSGLSVDNDYTHGQRSSRATSLGDIALPTAGYTYQPGTGRMETVTSGGVTATYRYNAATGWNEGVTYSGSGGLSSTRTPDALGRLDTISWSAGGNVVSGHDYTLNGMNRRTAAQREDGSQWSYGYNDRGEVTSAEKVDAASIPEPGKQFGFEFDGLGNRTSSTVSSLNDDQTLRTTSYTPTNELNQYETITHPQPGWLVLRGSVNAEASASIAVSIDDEPPTVRAGPLWHYETEVNNSSGAKHRIAEITAIRSTGGLNNGQVSTSRKGAVFIPPPSETLTYDWDGNLTSDARWDYTWDGENRLTAAEEKNIAISVAPGATPPTVTTRQRIECTYDSMNRRLSKKVYEQRTENGQPGTFELKQSLVFLYDGWNMIAELNMKPETSNLELLRSYEWGLDVSGTMTGAGGVGGLLVLRFHSAPSANSHLPSPGAHAPLYDGNGNITELVNLASNTLSARYEYGPFGETISVDGGAGAEANPFRFSTKYLDAETGMLHYGFRYYRPEDGRWLSRDPIEEQGGINLYGMVGNDAVNRWDYLGLATINARLTRAQRGYFAYYGSMEIKIDDEELGECCGFPITVKTIERPPGTGSGPYSLTGPTNTDFRFGDGPGSTNDTSPQALATAFGVSIPNKPSHIDQVDWDTAKTYEWNVSGGVNIHAGRVSGDSTGCVLVGTQYIARGYIFSGYPHVTDGLEYIVPSFDAAISIETQMKINAAISCAKRQGKNVNVKFSASGFPALPGGAMKPTPARPMYPTPPQGNGGGFWSRLFGGNQQQQVPQASAVNDPHAF